MLNAERIADVVNGLWREFRESQGAADANAGEGWSYVSGGLAKAVLTRDCIELGVDRFCGGWRPGERRRNSWCKCKKSHREHDAHAPHRTSNRNP